VVFAFLLAIHLSAPLGTVLPDVGGSPTTRYIVASSDHHRGAAAGALLGWLLYRIVRAIGLGFLTGCSALLSAWHAAYLLLS